MYYIAVIDCKFIEYWHQRQQWRTRSSDRSLGARLFSFSFSSFSVYFMMQATQNRIINFFLGEYCLTLPCDCVKDFFPLINLCIMIRSRLIMLCKLLNLQCRTGRICMWFSGGFAGLLLRCIKCRKVQVALYSLYLHTALKQISFVVQCKENVAYNAFLCIILLLLTLSSQIIGVSVKSAGHNPPRSHQVQGCFPFQLFLLFCILYHAGQSKQDHKHLSR